MEGEDRLSALQIEAPRPDLLAVGDRARPAGALSELLVLRPEGGAEREDLVDLDKRPLARLGTTRQRLLHTALERDPFPGRPQAPEQVDSAARPGDRHDRPDAWLAGGQRDRHRSSVAVAVRAKPRGVDRLVAGEGRERVCGVLDARRRVDPAGLALAVTVAGVV